MGSIKKGCIILSMLLCVTGCQLQKQSQEDRVLRQPIENTVRKNDREVKAVTYEKATVKEQEQVVQSKAETAILDEEKATCSESFNEEPANEPDTKQSEVESSEIVREKEDPDQDIEIPTLESQVNSPEDIIPEGYCLLASATGDLNKDGIEDYVGIVQQELEGEDIINVSPRILFALLQDADGLYMLSFQADKAVLRADEGGMSGDPFCSLSISRGSFLLCFYGGSAWRWGLSCRFRYQDEGWYLIGITTDYFHATSDHNKEYIDRNLLTGNTIKITTDDKGKETREQYEEAYKLVNVLDYQVWKEDYLSK